MQAAGGIDEHHVGVLRQGRGNGVVGHRGGVAVEFLLHYLHVGAACPFLELLDGGGAESVGGAEDNLVSGGLVLRGEFADGGGLAYTVDTHHKHDVRAFTLGDVEVALALRGTVAARSVGHHIGNDVVEQAVQLLGANVFVAGDTLFEVVDDFDGCLHTHIRRDKDFFELVKKVLVDGAAAQRRAPDFVEKALLGLFKTFVERLFFLFL